MLQLTTKTFIFAGTISLKDFQIAIKVNEDFFECKKGENETLQDLRNFPKKTTNKFCKLINSNESIGQKTNKTN